MMFRFGRVLIVPSIVSFQPDNHLPYLWYISLTYRGMFLAQRRDSSETGRGIRWWLDGTVLRGCKTTEETTSHHKCCQRTYKFSFCQLALWAFESGWASWKELKNTIYRGFTADGRHWLNVRNWQPYISIDIAHSVISDSLNPLDSHLSSSTCIASLMRHPLHTDKWSIRYTIPLWLLDWFGFLEPGNLSVLTSVPNRFW